MVPVREPTVDEAAAFIRVACEIESRKQLVEDRAGCSGNEPVM